MDWEALIDQLRPLGERMRNSLPPRLRDDPQVQAESQRLLLAASIRAFSDALVGDREHPMFVPELNIALNIYQPNSDTIYKSALIGKGGQYRLRGERGGIQVMRMAQLGPDTMRTGQHSAARAQHDFDSLALDASGCFDVLMSVERPDGHEGDWWKLDPETEKLMIRFVACDWGVEREPRLSIDRLDRPSTRPRPTAADLHARYAELPAIVGNAATMLVHLAEKLRDAGTINRLNEVDFGQMTGLARQSYYEGAYDLADDEALVVEARIPRDCSYWSLILTNEIYETTDWYNNQASLNGAQARLDSDGMFRAVISARDPGVPNWLDTAGYPRGAVQGRWLDCDENPLPSMRKVALSEVRGLLPPDTPVVSAAERDQALRQRRHGAQLRTIW